MAISSKKLKAIKSFEEPGWEGPLRKSTVDSLIKPYNLKVCYLTDNS